MKLSSSWKKITYPSKNFQEWVELTKLGKYFTFFLSLPSFLCSKRCNIPKWGHNTVKFCHKGDLTPVGVEWEKSIYVTFLVTRVTTWVWWVTTVIDHAQVWVTLESCDSCLWLVTLGSFVIGHGVCDQSHLNFVGFSGFLHFGSPEFNLSGSMVLQFIQNHV